MLLPSRVAIAISLHRIFEPGERVVVAVSGGPDSLALLSILRELLPVIPLHLTVAHFDHGWRAQSARDAGFVRGVASGFGFETRTARAAAHTPHTENAARIARYEFLRETAAATHSTAIALGHTQDDQVETVLLHLLRGSGSRGLAAMRRRDGDLARPLLDISRQEIEAYLMRFHLTPLRDPSNIDPRFARNRLRQDVLPVIDAFDPASRQLLARAADILSEEDRYLEEQAERLPANIVSDREAFAKLPPAMQRRAIRRLIPDANFLEVERIRRRASPDDIPAFGGRRLVATDCECDPSTFKARDQVGHLDGDLVRQPLTVATRRPGDRMRPLGLPALKRVQDILVDARVPRHLRDRLPIVSDAEEIVWIPGVTVADRKRVTTATRRQLHLEMEGV